MKLIRLDPKVKIEEYGKPNRKVLEGNPTTGTANIYSNRAGKFHCGVWESSPGKWEVEYTEEEFCFILEGEVILTNSEGHAEIFKMGDAFILPSGFKGTWETKKHVRKYYVIAEG